MHCHGMAAQRMSSKGSPLPLDKCSLTGLSPPLLHQIGNDGQPKKISWATHAAHAAHGVHSPNCRLVSPQDGCMCPGSLFCMDHDWTAARTRHPHPPPPHVDDVLAQVLTSSREAACSALEACFVWIMIGRQHAPATRTPTPTSAAHR